MTFHVGQKVVCVDADGLSGTIVVDTVYEIYRVEPRGVYLAQWKDGGGFLARRFRPVVTLQTDISIFTAMLNPSKRSVDA